jgi:hypothetical protein
MQMPWTTVEALTADGNIPWEGQDSAFIWLVENNVIMCDPRYTGVDFQTDYKLTEGEIKSLEYAEGIVENDIFYVATARINGKQYDAD